VVCKGVCEDATAINISAIYVLDIVDFNTNKTYKLQDSGTRGSAMPELRA
jgi:hypothetical protein